MSKIPTRDRSRKHALIRQTQEYYERNAEAYSRATVKGRMSTRHELFLGGLPKTARILDAGSGAGRDSAFFLRQGHDVSAFDASPTLCRLSRKRTGVATRQLRFQEFDEIEEYDGIWANASLLHVPRVELPDCISRLTRALKPGGLLYMSFKHGSGERVAPDGRFFTDLTSADLRSLIDEVQRIRVEKLWDAAGTDVYGEPTRWVHVLVRRVERLGKGGR